VRTIHQLSRRSSAVRRGRWSSEDKERLKELYGVRDDAAVARTLQRSVASVQRMAAQLFPQVVRTGPWTEIELSELRRHLGACAPEVIARILGRSVAEVNARISELDRFRRHGAWTRDEIAQLKQLYATRTDRDLGRILGRDVVEIERLAREHALAKDKRFTRKLSGRGATRMPRWRKEEIEFLEREYATRSNLELARALGRSLKSLVSKSHQLGLRKSSERRRRMGQENVALRWSMRSVSLR
jgi:hypothetical protein